MAPGLRDYDLCTYSSIHSTKLGFPARAMGVCPPHSHTGTGIPAAWKALHPESTVQVCCPHVGPGARCEHRNPYVILQGTGWNQPGLDHSCWRQGLGRMWAPHWGGNSILVFPDFWVAIECLLGKEWGSGYPHLGCCCCERYSSCGRCPQMSFTFLTKCQPGLAPVQLLVKGE